MNKTAKNIVLAIAAAVGAISWIGIGYSTLCIVNGGRWGMVIPLVLSIIGVVIAGQLSAMVDDRMERL